MVITGDIGSIQYNPSIYINLPKPWRITARPWRRHTNCACLSRAALLSRFWFLSDPGVPGLIYGSSCLSLSHRPFANLTDVTLADEDTNSILTDHANRALQGNVGMCHLSKAAHFLTGV